MEPIPQHGDAHQQEPPAGVALPWVTRAAAATLLGRAIAVAPEDCAAVEAEVAALAREAAARPPRRPRARWRAA